MNLGLNHIHLSIMELSSGNNEFPYYPTCCQYGILTNDAVGLHRDPAKGPGGRYVIVPKGWRAQDDQYLDSIFSSLLISTPPLIFRTDKCPTLLPEIGLKRDFTEEDPYKTFKLSLDPSDEEKRLFSVVMNSRMKAIMAEISSACAQCNALFMMFRPTSRNVIDEMITESLPPGGVALGVLDGSSNIISPEMFALMKTNMVPLSEDAMDAVSWNEGRTECPKACDDQNDDQKFMPDLNVNLTHLLIFEEESDRDYFDMVVQQSIPLGLLCAGGTNPLFRASVKALSNGNPLFVFKHTARTGHCFSSLIEYHADTQKGSTLKLEEVQSIEDRIQPQGKNVYEVLENFPDLCTAIAHNWPENYNESCVLHIDPLRDRPKDLLMGIINVMASVHGAAIELGGGKAEEDAVEYAWLMYAHLKKIENKQRLYAVILKSLIAILAFFATCVASISIFMDYEYDGSTVVSDTVLHACNIILPIILGICVTIYTTFSPTTKWACLTSAKARVESECFRYMCRVGAYRGGKKQSDHRIAFASTLQSIWDEVVSAEVVSNFPDKNAATIALSADEEKDYLFENLLSKHFLITNNDIGKAKKPLAQQSRKITDRNTALVTPTALDILDKDIEGGVKEEIKAAETSGPRNGKPSTGLHGFKVLSGDEYIKYRLLPEMNRLERQTPGIISNLKLMQIAIIIASSGGAVLAVYRKEIWIPVLLAFAHLLDVTVSFRQWPLKSQRNGYMYTRLSQILLWWKGLTLIQQRVPFFKFQLVDRVEKLILSEVEMITQSQVKKDEDIATSEDEKAGDIMAEKNKDTGSK